MKYVLEAACGSNIGRIRGNNEDSYYFNGETSNAGEPDTSSPLFERIETNIACFGLFDGMGGVEDGQIASYLSAKSFQRDCATIKETGMLSETFFLQAIDHMNETVCLEASKTNSNMGTTAVMLGFSEGAFYVCNIGDSRVYRLRDNRFVQISMDHVETIPPFMEKRQRKPRLSQCIGISPDEFRLEPYIAQCTANPDDIYLLCSDGLTDMLADNEIENVLRSGRDAGMCVKILIDEALKKGGRDNITVIIVKVLEHRGID